MTVNFTSFFILSNVILLYTIILSKFLVCFVILFTDYGNKTLSDCDWDSEIKVDWNLDYIDFFSQNQFLFAGKFLISSTLCC